MLPVTRTATGSYVSEARVMETARAHILSFDDSLGHSPPKLFKTLTFDEKYRKIYDMEEE